MTVSRDRQLLRIGMQAWPTGWAPPLEMGVQGGIVWAITRAPIFGINGYVLIPTEGHPWSKTIPSEHVRFSNDDESGYERFATEDLNVHGGITYGECGPGGGWIGFDTAHAGDVWPPEFDEHGMCARYREIDRHGRAKLWAKRWTTQMVIEEVKSLARQLAAIGADTPTELAIPATEEAQR